MNWWQKLKQNTLARIGAAILITFYLAVIFADFLAPYSPYSSQDDGSLLPPTAIHWRDTTGKLTPPYVYGTTQGVTNLDTGDRFLVIDRDRPTPISLLVKGTPY
ncbi:MAG: peptide transport system permease protein, partial [Cyanobacteriota bacterium]